MIFMILMAFLGMVFGYICMWLCISYKIGQEWQDLHDTREYIIAEMKILRKDLEAIRRETGNERKNILPFNRNKIK